MQGLTNVAGCRSAAGVKVDECTAGGEIQQRDATHDREQGPLVKDDAVHSFCAIPEFSTLDGQIVVSVTKAGSRAKRTRLGKILRRVSCTSESMADDVFIFPEQMELYRQTP